MTNNGEIIRPTANDSQLGDKTDRMATKGTAKKVYRAPVLTMYGDIRDVTLGTSIVPGESPGFESPIGGQQRGG